VGAAGPATVQRPPRPEAPFALRGDELWLEGARLGELSASLEGRAVWLLSHAALSAVAAGAAAGAAGPRTVAVADVGPPAVLALLAAAGWWARAGSPHELLLARQAGFAPERLVAGAAVADDGFIKEALVQRVAVLEVGSTPEHAGRDELNVQRVAEALGLPRPPASGAPDAAGPEAFAHCGGLLAPVLRGAPALALDASWPDTCRARHAWTLRHPLPASEATLEGLSGPLAAPPRRLTLHGVPHRGDGLLLPCREAARLQAFDPSWPELPVVLVRDERWRLLEPRPRPA